MTVPLAALLLLVGSSSARRAEEGAPGESTGRSPIEESASVEEYSATSQSRLRAPIPTGRDRSGAPEVRLDDMLTPTRGEALVLDRRALANRIQRLIGNDIPVREARLRHLFDRVPRMRVSFQGNSILLDREALRRLAKRVVGTDVAIDDVRLGDLLDNDLSFDAASLPQSLGDEALAASLRRILGNLAARRSMDPRRGWIERVNPVLDARFQERQELRQKYLEVKTLVRQVRLEGYTGENAGVLYDECEQRLLSANQADSVPLLEGHFRLEEEMDGGDVKSMSQAERIAFRWEARRRAFGPERADLLFATDEAMERYEIDRLAIEADRSASKQQKDARLAKRRSALKVELAAKGTYVSFPDETQALLQSELRKRFGARFDRMTPGERSRETQRLARERLPAGVRESVEQILQRQAGVSQGGSAERRQP
jgi:hypothetical protein